MQSLHLLIWRLIWIFFSLMGATAFAADPSTGNSASGALVTGCIGATNSYNAALKLAAISTSKYAAFMQSPAFKTWHATVDDATAGVADPAKVADQVDKQIQGATNALNSWEYGVRNGEFDRKKKNNEKVKATDPKDIQDDEKVGKALDKAINQAMKDIQSRMKSKNPNDAEAWDVKQDAGYRAIAELPQRLGAHCAEILHGTPQVSFHAQYGGKDALFGSCAPDADQKTPANYSKPDAACSTFMSCESVDDSNHNAIMGPGSKLIGSKAPPDILGLSAPDKGEVISVECDKIGGTCPDMASCAQQSKNQAIAPAEPEPLPAANLMMGVTPALPGKSSGGGQ